MYPKRLFAFLLFYLLSGICLAQDKKYDVSPPTDLKQTGVNKVLCMKNGNTMLFHFEPGKPLIVKVFDSVHKEVASQKILCRILDLYILKDVIFKGLFEINGEAVLFMEQEHLSKTGLVRLRFGSRGELTEEILVRNSRSVSKRTYFYVVKNKEEDNYSILFCEDVAPMKECQMDIVKYGKDHQTISDIPLELDRKKYDDLQVTGAEATTAGTCVMITLSNLETNQTASHPGEFDRPPSIYDRFLAVFYIAPNSTTPKMKMAHLGTNVFPLHTYCTYNAVAQTFNILLCSYSDVLYKFGNEVRPTVYTSDLLLTMSKEEPGMSFKWITNTDANNYLNEHSSAGKKFEGLPVYLSTNRNGLSTSVFESFYRYHNLESYVHQHLYETYLENIAITQFDDDGNEIWGAVLPKTQYYKSYEHYYYANHLSRNWQQDRIFGDSPPEVYARQFVSLNTYSHNSNFYVIYNDVNKNFNNTLDHPGDTVYTFDGTNTCCYKINKQKEVTKSYLFGAPGTDEYKASFIEGADFDEQRGVYAALVQYKKGEDISLCMAWSKLD